jgi:hypothetical protein
LEIRKNCALQSRQTPPMRTGLSVDCRRRPIHTVIMKLRYTNGVAIEYQGQREGLPAPQARARVQAHTAHWSEVRRMRQQTQDGPQYRQA